MKRLALRFVPLSVLLAAPVLGQMDSVEIDAEKITDQIWVLTGRGGNIGVCVGDDGVFLVDDQFAPLTEKIRAKIAELGGGDVRFVLNTHFHPDHTGGNENLGAGGAVVVAHENVRRRLEEGGFPHPLSGAIREPAPEGNWPVVTFSEDVTFWFNEDEIHVFHVDPAHTDGDAIVHFRNANVMHVGDVVFGWMYPFIDFAAGGRVDGMVAAVDRLVELADENTKIMMGHGPVGDREYLRTYRTMLATVADRVREAIARGYTLQDAQAVKPTAEFDEAWGGGIDADSFVRMVYFSLAPE